MPASEPLKGQPSPQTVSRAGQLAERLIRGERRAVARCISHVEDGTPVGRQLLDRVYPHTGAARRIGVTGPPGSGKSTLVHGLAQQLRRAGQRVGILAIDPTSPFSGGAILGDRIRMPAATGDEGLYMRSMASRGSLGGVAASTYEASEILEAAGFDWILIETVGVGQSELEVVELADTTILVLVPESGDSVQAMKAGIMEIADIFVVNKYDREGGDRLIRDLETTLDLTGWQRAGGWTPPVAKSIALRDEGIGELLQEIERHGRWLLADPERQQAIRAEKIGRRARVLLNRTLLEAVWRKARIADDLKRAIEPMARRELSPYAWAEGVLEKLAYGREE
jgi:LAO/AO transport system kinase